MIAITETEGREIIEGAILLIASVSNYLKARTAQIQAEQATRTAQTAQDRAKDAAEDAKLSHAASLLNEHRLHDLENGGTIARVHAVLHGLGIGTRHTDNTTNSTMAQEAISNGRPDSDGETDTGAGSDNPAGGPPVDTDRDNGSQSTQGPVLCGDPW